MAASQIKGSGTEASRPYCCQGNSESGQGLSSSFLESIAAAEASYCFPGIVGTSRFKFLINQFCTDHF